MESSPLEKFQELSYTILGYDSAKYGIYNILNSIYHRVEFVKEEDSLIYVPEINCDSLSKSDTIQNSSIENIFYFYDFFKLSSNELLNNKK